MTEFSSQSDRPVHGGYPGDVIYARPTAETDPGDCAWCWQEAMGWPEPCPYHGEEAQRDG